MSNLVGVMVLANEGERARLALAALSRVSKRLVVLHDGPPNDSTVSVVREMDAQLLVYERRGCKEPQLAIYFGRDRDPAEEFYAHVDADEVLSDELISEIKRTNFDAPTVYGADLSNIRADGTLLRFRPRAARTFKPFLFHISCVEAIIGIPHRGLVYKQPIRAFMGKIYHFAPHLDLGFLDILRKEMRFTATECQLRSGQLFVYQGGVLQLVPPDSPSLRSVDRLRASWPLACLVPATLYRTWQSLKWFCETRNLPAMIAEARLLLARPITQAALCWMMHKLRKNPSTFLA